jgi:hypothetical protein
MRLTLQEFKTLGGLGYACDLFFQTRKILCKRQ